MKANNTFFLPLLTILCDLAIQLSTFFRLPNLLLDSAETHVPVTLALLITGYLKGFLYNVMFEPSARIHQM